MQIDRKLVERAVEAMRYTIDDFMDLHEVKADLQAALDEDSSRNIAGHMSPMELQRAYDWWILSNRRLAPGPQNFTDILRSVLRAWVEAGRLDPPAPVDGGE